MSRKLTKGANTSVSTTASDTTTDSSSSVSAAGQGSTIPSTTSHLHGPPPSVLNDGLPLPRLIVFDLDYTLWPFWVDTHVNPPLKSSGGPAHLAFGVDKTQDTFSFYGDVPPMLHALQRAGVRLAVASRSEAPELAREMLKILHVAPRSASDGGPVTGGGGGAAPSSSFLGREKAKRALDFFDAGLEIYPSSKVRHFEAIQKRTGVAYGDMIFFDDEPRNREVEHVLGVPFRLVVDGMTWQELEKGVQDWRSRRR